MMYNQTAIFHVHGYRCRHATDERKIEYIEKAIELDASQIIFTDHAPFPKNPFNYRTDMDELQDYVKTLHILQKKYADMITVKTGLEI